jgi:hypothetical protein
MDDDINDTIIDPMLRKFIDAAKEMPRPHHSVVDERFKSLMLDRFMLVNGYLASFMPEVRERWLSDDKIAKRFATDNKLLLSEFSDQIDEFMSLDPFPIDLVADCTNLYFKSDRDRRKWLERIVDITKREYAKFRNMI